ncbi:hypothetical protein [Paraburkholderia sp. MM5384-R2]|uniref:hypothetical protein n=1 Tax=Paraburkholderia sp. MM5384-R2 TaxID=2723097 RepID=UPI0016208150|nr:hypothetical protein [Paraburkholderia sp. MM5384-R2]MBB5496323.1 hypothetical protein [Paraburkholderia sp. MM5384-R2]
MGEFAVRCTARDAVVLLSDGPLRVRFEAPGARMIGDARVSGIARRASTANCLSTVPGIFRQVRAIAAAAGGISGIVRHDRNKKRV